MAESLLLMIADRETLSVIEAVLSREYRLTVVPSWEEGLALLEKRRRDFSAVLVELSLAPADGDFAKKLMGDDPFALLPVIGVALFPDHGASFKALYRAADTALYRVKNSGKAACLLYDGQ